MRFADPIYLNHHQVLEDPVYLAASHHDSEYSSRASSLPRYPVDYMHQNLHGHKYAYMPHQPIGTHPYHNYETDPMGLKPPVRITGFDENEMHYPNYYHAPYYPPLSHQFNTYPQAPPPHHVHHSSAILGMDYEGYSGEERNHLMWFPPNNGSE